MGEHKVCQPTQNRHSRGGGEREGLTENVFEEIMAENFPNLKKETSPDIEGPKQVEPKQTYPKTYSI